MVFRFSAVRPSCVPVRSLIRWSLAATLIGLPVVAMPLVARANPLPSSLSEGPPPATKQLLKRGNRSSAVRSLQQKLKQVGVFNGPVTGFFGPQTEAAVRRFQRSRGLPIDGIAGPRTLNALNAATTTFQPFSQGAKGERVREMQFRLLLLGHLNGSITSTFDNTTKHALMQFQRSRGITPDGVVGRGTWTSLQNAISSAQIQTMQRRLQAAEFYTGAVDGRLNASTQRAVQAAQGVYGVSAGDILRGSY